MNPRRANIPLKLRRKPEFFGLVWLLRNNTGINAKKQELGIQRGAVP